MTPFPRLVIEAGRGKLVNPWAQSTLNRAGSRQKLAFDPKACFHFLPSLSTPNTIVTDLVFKKRSIRIMPFFCLKPEAIPLCTVSKKPKTFTIRPSVIYGVFPTPPAHSCPANSLALHAVPSPSTLNPAHGKVSECLHLQIQVWTITVLLPWTLKTWPC